MDHRHGKKAVSQCFVKNICISDVETGIIVFQKVYKWKESSAFFNLGGLIQVFYQFAREVDDGQISCVNFESGRKITTRLNQDQLHSRNQTMQMKSVKSTDIIVSVFFDMQGADMPTPDEDYKLDVLMHAVQYVFTQDYLERLIAKRPKLQQEMEEQNEANEELDSRAPLPFEDFSFIADQLHHQLFPQQAGSVLQDDVILDDNFTIEDHVQMQVATMRSFQPI